MVYAKKLVYDEDMIEEYATLVHTAAAEHGTPNFAIDLAGRGLRENEGPAGVYYTLDGDGLRMMAERWREGGFEPRDFSYEIDRLADAVLRPDGS